MEYADFVESKSAAENRAQEIMRLVGTNNKYHFIIAHIPVTHDLILPSKLSDAVKYPRLRSILGLGQSEEWVGVFGNKAQSIFWIAYPDLEED